jgi:hypothetical protein
MATVKNAPKFNKIKQVTLPTIKILIDVEYFLTLNSKFRLGSQQPAKEGQEPRKPATIIEVTNLETGEMGLVVCNKVLSSTITEMYGDDYVGRSFSIVKENKKPGRDYHTFSISEVSAGE